MSVVPHFGGNAPPAIQSRREFAQNSATAAARYARLGLACKRRGAGGCSSKRVPANCQHRYPSPCRSALSQSRSASPFWGAEKISAAIRFSAIFGVEFAQRSDDSARVNKTNKGSIPCLISKCSSRPPQPLPLAHAPVSTRMANALLWAQASAVSRVKRSTAIAQPARLSVLSAAHWPTTSKRANRKDQDQAPTILCLIRTSSLQKTCATPTPRRRSSVLKHRQGAFLCARSSNSSQFSPFLVSRPAPARLRHQHPWLNLWSTPWKPHPPLPCRLSATPMAIAPRRATSPVRASARHHTIISRRRGCPPVAVLRLKDQAHV